MKKIVLLALSLVFILAACGNDEPDDPNKLTRVQDGNGKVFLEKGKLVDANLDYTQDQLIEALNRYEWQREYSFYYDNKTISGKDEMAWLPIKMHTDSTIEYDTDIDAAKFWDMSISGKRITATMRYNPTSSSYYPPVNYTVVALDLTPNAGRIVMDCKWTHDVDGFNASTLYIRMVWKAIIP